MKTYYQTDPGKVRSHNEDSVTIVENNNGEYLVEGKTIYYGTVKAGEVAYGKKFRLRMWISDAVDSVESSDLKFTVKVNVAAAGNN